MARLGNLLDHQLSNAAFAQFTMGVLSGNHLQKCTQPLHDLHQVRRFLGGTGALAIFDLPWMPFYLLVAFALHPALGLLGIGGAGILVFVAFLNERSSHRVVEQAQAAAGKGEAIAQSVRRNAEAVAAMGMFTTLREHWQNVHGKSIDIGNHSGNCQSLYGSVTKSLRLAIQSLILGTGAYLAIHQEISAGSMIAASIIFARALAPVEQVIGQWRAIAETRASWSRLKDGLALDDATPPARSLTPPRETLTVDSLAVGAPGSDIAIIQKINFSLAAGDGLGVLGVSGSGKSTLAKALVGAWRVGHGEIRLDGATLSQWHPDVLGHHIGYLPQDIELFDGTIAENISRFKADVEFADVIEAGKLSGAHDVILKLPDGYQTIIGIGGMELSAGQRQRVALARAVFSSPFLIVLDEPNSNLDASGDDALKDAILRLRDAGSIVIVIAHRHSMFDALNKILILQDGVLQAFGPKDAVLEHVANARRQQMKRELKVAS